MTLRTLCLAVAFVLVVPAVVGAQAGDEARLAEARESFERGRAAYEREDYVGALDHFRRSYELTGSPDILYNLGTVADRLGRSADALGYFEQFLRARPRAEESEAVSQRIAALREEVGATAETPAEGQGEEPEEATPPPERAPPEEEPAVAAPSPPPAESSGGGLRWAFVPAGLAVASGAVATGMWLRANAIHDDLATRCAREGCTQDDVDDSGGELRVLLTNVFLGVSLAAVAAAVTVGVIELTGGGDEDEPTVDVALGLGHVAVRGRF